MNTFTQKFADLTIAIRKAKVAIDAAVKTQAYREKERGDLVRGVKELVSGVYSVVGGQVVIDDEDNIFFYEAN